MRFRVRASAEDDPAGGTALSAGRVDLAGGGPGARLYVSECCLSRAADPTAVRGVADGIGCTACWVFDRSQATDGSDRSGHPTPFRRYPSTPLASSPLASI